MLTQKPDYLEMISMIDDTIMLLKIRESKKRRLSTVPTPRPQKRIELHEIPFTPKDVTPLPPTKVNP